MILRNTIKFIFSLTFIVIIASCKNSRNDIVSESPLNLESDILLTEAGDTLKLKLSNNVDNVILEYWDNLYANKYIFHISDTLISYNGAIIFKEERKIESQRISNGLIEYINKFYIDKNEDIIVGAKDTEPLITDNPSIRVKVYDNKREVLNQSTKIENHLIYHPDYIELYELLKDLTDRSHTGY